MTQQSEKTNIQQSAHRFILPENSPMFGADFTFGASTSSFQIEGATELDGRIESIWDRFCKTAGKVAQQHTGDIACDHYHLWQQDLALLADLGVDAYRFSIAWPRVVHADGRVNQKGIDFYKAILEKLNTLDIKPYVTLYHWDLPQYIEDRGGWLNRDCAYRFADYSEIFAKHLGSLCYSIATLNEPWCSAFLGYGEGIHAPGITGQRNAKQAGHHLLLAHGLGMQVLRRDTQNVKLGVVLNMGPATPKTERFDDKIASLLAEAGGNNWFLEPIIEGRYPEIVNKLKPEEAPLVLEGDMQLISAPNDFIGINYYTRIIVAYDNEKSLTIHKNAGAEETNFGWEIYPQGLTDLLVNINKQYDLPELMITENGASGVDEMVDGEVHDDQRFRYFDSHLLAVNEAIAQGVNVTGYFAWSLLDNFEWAEGYTKRFGLYHVDFDTLKRTPKTSAKAFKALLSDRQAHNSPSSMMGGI